MILQIIGTATIIILVLFLFIFIFFRLKWKKWMQSFQHSTETPSVIHLVEDISPEWFTEDDRAQIESSGFTMGLLYMVQGMPDVSLSSFFHINTGIAGALYTHPVAGKWYDLVAMTEDKEITVTSAPMGEEIDVRPENVKVQLNGQSLEELFDKIQTLTDGLHLKPITKESFREEFEDSYAKDMAWRNQRSGVTEEEIRRVADNMEEAIDNKTVAQGFKETKLQELYRWHDEGLIEFKRLSEKYSDRDHENYFLVSNAIHNDLFMTYLADYLNLNEKQVADFNSLHKDRMSNQDLFDRISTIFSPKIRPIQVGEINTPIPAYIYQGR